MKVLNLQCAQGHGFEGWFGSDDDYQQQSARGLIECPSCADKTVLRLPSAPRLNLVTSRQDSAGSATVEQHGSVEALWMQVVRHVIANTEDVGQRFADEARRMHYGEVEPRDIRGQTTPEQARALDEEGIEVYTLPVLDVLKGPAH